MQRLDSLRPLPLTQLVRRRNLEERRRRLHQPFRLNRTDNMHVLFRRLDQTLIDDVFRGLAKERRRRMQEDRCALNEGLVALRWIFARAVAEEA